MIRNVYLKRVVISILLLAGIAVSYWYAGNLTQLRTNDGIRNMMDYYVQKDGSVDILILGSSHAGQNIDASVLWDDYGYSIYNLWGGDQPLADSYFHLEEALKYQKPKLVVLEGSYIAAEVDYNDKASWYWNLMGMKMSPTKIKEMIAAVPVGNWSDILLRLPVYHERITQLQESDFRFGNRDIIDKGSRPLGMDKNIHQDIQADLSTWGFEDYDDVGSMAFRPDYDMPPIDLFPKADKYYRAIIDKCKSEQIPLFVFMAPSPCPEELTDAYGRYKRAAEIAEEQGVFFIDYNDPTNDIGFTDGDFADATHLNRRGGRKLARELGRVISQHYSIPDHRGDEAYQSWDCFSAMTKADYLKTLQDRDEYMKEVKQGGFFVFKIDCLKDQHSVSATDYSQERPVETMVGDDLENQMYEYDGHVFTADLEQYPRVFIRFDGNLLKDLNEQAEVYMVYDKYRDMLVDTVYAYPYKQGELER